MTALPDAPRTHLAARVAFALLALAGLAQGACFVWAARHVNAASLRRQGWVDLSAAPGDGADVYAGLLRAFHFMQARLPTDARVLLITDLPLIIPFEFYFLPRGVRRLHVVNAKRLQRWTAVVPFFDGKAEQHMQNLDDMGLLFTPERLQRHLAWADHVVTIYGETGLGAVREWLELEAEYEGARLYRVRGEGR
ncbi:MAG: hypothetical protein DRQ55_11930 [Planctomycetota bacterium]|nr:MAG: hypothetical protein DRQ55_11930 [Planctomycetota bacterium]